VSRLRLTPSDCPAIRVKAPLTVECCVFLDDAVKAVLPIVQFIESASQVVQEVLHEIQIQTLETIFTLSAEQVAGGRTPGKASG
jgi:hypothetical protein